MEDTLQNLAIHAAAWERGTEDVAKCREALETVIRLLTFEPDAVEALVSAAAYRRGHTESVTGPGWDVNAGGLTVDDGTYEDEDEDPGPKGKEWSCIVLLGGPDSGYRRTFAVAQRFHVYTRDDAAAQFANHVNDRPWREQVSAMIISAEDDMYAYSLYCKGHRMGYQRIVEML